MTTSAIRPDWNPMTTGLMILGFIIFWPLGLAMLAYIIWGERFQEFAGRARDQAKAHSCRHKSRFNGFGRTGNLAFDDYREAELRRLDEERRKLEEERFEFEKFVQELRRVKDREEFDRFMQARDARSSAEDINVEDDSRPAKRTNRKPGKS